MAIDASIYGAIQQPKPVNLLADYANLMQLQGAQQANQLNALKFDVAKREMQDGETLNRLYSGAVNPDGTIDRSKLFAGVAGANLGSKIPGLQKTFADSDAAAVKADAEKFKLAKERYQTFHSAMGALAQDPNLSKDLVLQTGQALVQQGLLPKAMYDQTAAGLPDDPAQLRGRLTQFLKMQLPPEKVFELFAPKPTEVNNGQTKAFIDTNPNSPTYGQQTAGGAIQMQMTPGEVATNNLGGARLREETRHNTAMEGYRGQEVTNQQGQKTQQGVIELRKEFNALPEVKNFREVLPIIESVQRAPNTPAGDIDLIYGVGKVMDPNSVVREGEMNLVIKSGSPAQRLAGFYNYVKGGGRLSQAQRAELMTIMNSRVAGLKTNFDNARKTYETAAERGGLPKDQIFIDNPLPAKTVDFGALPTGGGKVVDFGSLN